MTRLREAADFAAVALFCGAVLTVLAVVSHVWWLLIPVAVLCPLALWVGDKQATLYRR